MSRPEVEMRYPSNFRCSAFAQSGAAVRAEKDRQRVGYPVHGKRMQKLTSQSFQVFENLSMKAKPMKKT
ncbi:hypothetical protein [Acetobacter sp. UBA5411]|uniref:hypothetical protein n=1 Tax=Acetobacter sp. UBA5411 TaxID=1945905 RepID=UPI0025C5FB20|nr:hypothetical protein [Acetobacter sp. UBA5411]